MITPLYHPCTSCRGTSFRIVKDTSKSETDPAYNQLICTGCGRHSKPSNWNAVNPVKEVSPCPSK